MQGHERQRTSGLVVGHVLVILLGLLLRQVLVGGGLADAESGLTDRVEVGEAEQAHDRAHAHAHGQATPEQPALAVAAPACFATFCRGLLPVRRHHHGLLLGWWEEWSVFYYYLQQRKHP